MEDYTLNQWNGCDVGLTNVHHKWLGKSSLNSGCTQEWHAGMAWQGCAWVCVLDVFIWFSSTRSRYLNGDQGVNVDLGVEFQSHSSLLVVSSTSLSHYTFAQLFAKLERMAMKSSSFTSFSYLSMLLLVGLSCNNFLGVSAAPVVSRSLGLRALPEPIAVSTAKTYLSECELFFFFWSVFWFLMFSF